MGRLGSFVHVQDEHNVMHVFGPADEVPAWAAKRITNPAAWDEAPEIDEEPSRDGVPPRSGKGSGKDAWAAYAAAQSVEVPAEASRDEIIVALVEAGVVEAE